MTQPRLTIYAFAICGAVTVCAPVLAQAPIFIEEAPRPPANVPAAPKPRSLPPQTTQQPIPRQPVSPQFDDRQSLRPPAPIGNDISDEPDGDNGDEPDDEADEADDRGPARAERPVMPAPPSTRPRDRAIESQDLTAPPGTAPATGDVQTRPPVPGPGQIEQNHGSIAPGLPSTEPQPTPSIPTDTVVVAPPPQRIANPTAVFAGLDKITGRIISFDVAISETVQFGALQVTPRACYSRPPTERANTDAFIEVDEVTLNAEVKRIFTGWMFAASPGLHAVEHPIYDVWLTDCKGAQPQAVVESVSDQNDRRKPAIRPAPQPAARPQAGAQPQRGVLPPPR